MTCLNAGGLAEMLSKTSCRMSTRHRQPNRVVRETVYFTRLRCARDKFIVYRYIRLRRGYYFVWTLPCIYRWKININLPAALVYFVKWKKMSAQCLFQ